MRTPPLSQPPAGESDAAFVVRSLRWAIVAAAAAAVVLFLLWVLKAALTPLVTAFFFAYVLDPLIDWFEARGVPRRLSILCLMALLGLGLLVALFFLLPKLLQDLASLAESLPSYLEQLQDTVIPKLEKRLDVELPGSLQDVIRAVRTGVIPLPLDAIRGFIAGLLTYVTGTINTLIGLLVIPILAYYILVDFDRITATLAEWTPPRYRSYLLDKARTTNELISGFLRGQLLVATTLGALYSIGFSVIGIDLAIGVGLLAGVLALVPYLGNFVAVTTATVLCVLKFGIDVHLLEVLGWYVVVQNLEGFALTPLIVGQRVGLHPATVIVALLIGGDIFGFLGLLIAVPAAAVVKVFAEELLESYRGSSVFIEPELADPAGVLHEQIEPEQPATRERPAQE